MPTSLRPLLIKEGDFSGNPPAGEVALYSVDGSALLMKDDAGNITTFGSGGGGGSKISALPAISSPVSADELPVNDGGVTKRITLGQINTFVAPISNASIAAQTLGTGDTYLTRSNVTFVAGRLQQGSFYRAVIDMTKTAAGTATAVINLRFGTAGTTADTARCVFTFPSAQTAAVDNARFTVNANMRVVGASAVVQGVLVIERTNTTTGFVSTGGLQFMAPIRVTSATFDSTTVTNIGISVNAGASSAWTTQLVQASIENLA